MFDGEQTGVVETIHGKNVSAKQQRVALLETAPQFHCYDLYQIFKRFREKNEHKELIQFLVKNYPTHVKNKTFNFVNTGHLFHSLYAYIPALTGIDRERKQIRLSVECVQKLFESTINPFKLYGELFDAIRSDEQLNGKCPCQLLITRREVIKDYVRTIKEKQFDTKPPKLKKDNIDNIMYKYSINWKNILLKKKLGENSKSIKKKRKIKTRKIMTDESIYFNFNDSNVSRDDNNSIIENDGGVLPALAGLTLSLCSHEFVTLERQLRAGDEAVSFIRHCARCGHVDK